MKAPQAFSLLSCVATLLGCGPSGVSGAHGRPPLRATD